MSEKLDVEELDLSDSELIKLIKSHGADRRSVMKALGVGTVLSLGVGTAAADHDQPHPPHIDSHYGYSAPADETLPGKLRPDHEVGLHLHPHSLEDEDPTTMPFHFAPTGLKIEEGDIIRFNLTSPEHTVTAYHEGQGRQQRVPDDNSPFSSPVINAGGFWLYEFDSPGTYDLFCATHELFGMVMRIVVGDPSDADYDDTFGPAGPPPQPRPPASRGELNALGVETWPFPTAAEVLDTDALTVSNIESSGSVSVSDVEADL
jgi:plastocyanin